MKVFLLLLLAGPAAAAPHALMASVTSYPFVSGLLEVPALSGEGSGLAVFSAPKYGGQARTYDNLDALPTEELEDGRFCALVYASTGPWRQIAVEGGKGWVAASEAGAFHPLTELLKRQKVYLLPSWERALWSKPGGKKKPFVADDDFAAESDGRIYAKVQEFRTVKGRLWARVDVIEGEPCGKAPEIETGGWLPVHDDAGALVLWFVPEGCR